MIRKFCAGNTTTACTEVIESITRPCLKVVDGFAKNNFCVFLPVNDLVITYPIVRNVLLPSLRTLREPRSNDSVSIAGLILVRFRGMQWPFGRPILKIYCYNDLFFGLRGFDMSSPTTDIEFMDASAERSLFFRRSSNVYTRIFKRVLDVSLVLLALPFVLPVVLVMSLLVMLDGGMPFYSQLRVGREGRVFRIWKMRSMVPNADALLAEYLAKHPEARAEWEATQKLKLDPRVTRIGRLIRKCSMDELPQLWNVVTGSMSLVGPRPMMPSQEQYYSGLGYYRQRPGITGLWQISDRNEGEFVGRVRYDDIYDRTVSFQTDIRVLLRTVLVVLRGTGY